MGLLSPTLSQVSVLATSSVERVALGVGWVNVEPYPNVFDTNVLAQLRNAISFVQSKGMQVSLDLGLHYPPSWVFSLSGQTRFINQYGDVWHGAASEDVPNAVFNPAVRAAEVDYIAHVADAINPSTVASVRVGGLLSGELRYPINNYNGHTMSLWMYDPAAQAKAPYAGWRPGSGTTTVARASLAYYFGSLTAYETWLMKTVNANFPDVDQQIMFPSWGLRPGVVDSAVAAGLHNTTGAEINGAISEGLEWVSQVKAITTAGVNGTVYCTWVDAPSQGSTVQQVPPVQYLASLAAAYGLPVAGENTGGGGKAALNLTMQRATANHLTGVMYMSGNLIDNGSAGISLAELKAGALAFTG
ncbi:MAG: hypothetical protein DLM58_10750 [Pseudonocardiales bacterium]|nr:MAG: hypothetical protein DLM58_10750 [Pseudonocardiales bacterium]